MRRLARPQTYTRRTTKRNRAIMLLEECSLIDEVFLRIRKVIQRIHMQILIIGQNEEDVWFPPSVSLAVELWWCSQWLLNLRKRKAGEQREQLQKPHDDTDASNSAIIEV
jgi:hypothetical protein